ncbi:MAG: MlaC/ttg2D family ABC transporter substrate-binding protein [Gammaproteobacteria bacterium]|jgi:phospholipid transport system substrate-binding protein
MDFRAVISSILVSAFVLVSSSAVAATDTAGDVVKNTTNNVIERLNIERDQLDAYPDRIYGLINELVIPHFDFTNMSRLVLGGAWNSATESQRAAFQVQFKTLLVRTYATALKEYSDNKIEFYPEESKEGSRIVLVRTEVMDAVNQSSVPIHYRMLSTNDVWKVVDVTVGGVSLVSTYRGSFASEIRKSGLNSLVSNLIERNVKSDMVQ